MVNCNHGKYQFRVSKKLSPSIKVEFTLDEDGKTSYEIQVLSLE